MQAHEWQRVTGLGDDLYLAWIAPIQLVVIPAEERFRVISESAVWSIMRMEGLQFQRCRISSFTI